MQLHSKWEQGDLLSYNQTRKSMLNWTAIALFDALLICRSADLLSLQYKDEFYVFFVLPGMGSTKAYETKDTAFVIYYAQTWH